MSNEIFNPMEIDAIGEIMNISLGSSATAVSNMLDSRVDITTPTVTVVNAEDFTLGDLEPAVGVEIKYVTGLEGSNIMLLKFRDVKVIVDILMGMETPDEEFELNDLALSAVCEVMNQMMGAASTALSDFLGRMVNISTPQTFDGNNVEELRRERFPVAMGPIVVVRFALSIGESLKSEFMNVMSVDLARELIAGFGLGDDDSASGETAAPAPEPEPEPAGGKTLSQAEIEAMMGGAAAAPAPAPEPAGGKTLSQAEIEAMMMGGAAAVSAPEPAGGKTLSQAEIEAMMMGGAAAAPAPEPAGGKTLSQAEIEAMMGGAAAAPAPEPAGGGMLSQAEIEAMMAGAAAPAAAPPAPAPAAAAPQAVPAAGMPDQMAAMGYWGMPQQMQQMQQMLMQQMQQMQQMAQLQQMQMQQQQQQQQQQPPKAQESRVIKTKAPAMPVMEDGTALSQDQSQNLDLIMGVPLEVAVEIGRTRKKVQEILALSKGSLVVLDKLAGDQVDVYVNGKCIARGDVVVVDDNFGIRVNEILKKPGLEELT